MVSAAPQPAVLLDGNVLIALSYNAHVHYAAAARWFAANELPYATCPITQGTLIRQMLNLRIVPDTATSLAVLRRLTEHPLHRFWPDALDYLHVDMKGVIGHKQVTDAYLVALAKKNKGKLATFDKGMAALHPGVVELIA